MQSNPLMRPLYFGSFMAMLGVAVATSGCATQVTQAETSTGTPAPSPQEQEQVVCPGLPCPNSLDIVLHLSPEDAAQGQHRFELIVDGRSHRCSLDVATPGESAEAYCGAGGSIRLGATMRGITVPSPFPGQVMHTEEPVPGEYQATLTIHGTPTEVRILHTVENRVAFDRTIRPTYLTVRPNGARCEPVCQAANVELR